ncbi:acetyl-CoA decarbonylase/synthase complex subunit gamma [Candidatus Acetothermia bacterium]|jgi:acetyl-CoA decarbonylase/synthase complex subunit gamma|nr:acetyl-CoA decarbonylase/synthase complex subunit gamma [Candidatus Acetothermia bacterium]MCI2427340.1 acetyl-CoA decarbonylase/synthase complex subunit gamma [Candidatus Acetothermia bacterium]MCI2428155.1 acetyl-CoA decarbonylase/synthase complex subunit gamma [Candidatus Acetothermia bacterium]
MPIKGTDIQKRLPGTNCKECGLPTCFGFAMKLATGKLKPDACPYIAQSLREEIENLLTPPVKLVVIGTGEQALNIGEEEVMFRHEKTFFHPPGLALLISDTETDAEITAKIDKLQELQFKRVGMELRAELLALQSLSGEKAKFIALVEKVLSQAATAGIVLIAKQFDHLLAAQEICNDRKPLLYPITAANIDDAIAGLNERATPIGVQAEGIEELVPLVEKLRSAGFEQIVLDPSSKNLIEAIRDQTLIRRAALKKDFRLLGFPTITFPCFLAKEAQEEVLLAASLIAKYAGIIVVRNIKRHSLFPLLVERMNIYTDPRRPMTVEEKVYEINSPDAAAPVILTTNFALTYFAVSSEMEASKVPSFLCIQNTEGLCVLAAWSTGKFAADTIASYIKRSGIADKINHRNLIIPGYVAQIKGELEEELPDWQIIVGTREASGIPALLKRQKQLLELSGS